MSSEMPSGQEMSEQEITQWGKNLFLAAKEGGNLKDLGPNIEKIKSALTDAMFLINPPSRRNQARILNAAVYEVFRHDAKEF